LEFTHEVVTFYTVVLTK